MKYNTGASLGGSAAKNSPAMQERRVLFLDWEEPLEIKNLPAMQETPARLLGRKILWRRERLPYSILELPLWLSW